jgi:competence protein ComEA
MSHDDDGDRDGGGSASIFKVRAKPFSCQLHFLLAARSFLAPVPDQAENGCVPARTRFAAVSVAILAVIVASCAMCVAAAPQSNTTQAAPQPSAKTKSTPPPEARVDINHATVEELLKVPGMTPSWAGRIVRFRPYRSKQDLVEHGVLPSDVYDRIKDYVIAHRGGQ